MTKASLFRNVFTVEFAKIVFMRRTKRCVETFPRFGSLLLLIVTLTPVALGHTQDFSIVVYAPKAVPNEDGLQESHVLNINSKGTQVIATNFGLVHYGFDANFLALSLSYSSDTNINDFTRLVVWDHVNQNTIAAIEVPDLNQLPKRTHIVNTGAVISEKSQFLFSNYVAQNESRVYSYDWEQGTIDDLRIISRSTNQQIIGAGERIVVFDNRSSRIINSADFSQSITLRTPRSGTYYYSDLAGLFFHHSTILGHRVHTQIADIALQEIYIRSDPFPTVGLQGDSCYVISIESVPHLVWVRLDEISPEAELVVLDLLARRISKKIVLPADTLNPRLTRYRHKIRPSLDGNNLFWYHRNENKIVIIDLVSEQFKTIHEFDEELGLSFDFFVGHSEF